MARDADSGVRLVAFDMEGVLTAEPTVWELVHRELGTWESHGRPYWERYLAGEFHYDEFARMDVAVWRGASEEVLRCSARQVPLARGCRRALRSLRRAGVALALISNGLTHLAERFEREFGFGHVFANRALASEGRLTGEVEIRVPYEGKGHVLANLARELGLKRGQIAAVGDSPADIGMFRQAAVSVAVRPTHDSVSEAATELLPDHDLEPLSEVLLGR